MLIQQFLILLGTGVAIGFLAGLLGVGGGPIMTPVQYWFYTSSGTDPDLAIKMSFATSLAVILPTAASGVWRYQRLGCIRWRAAILMGIFTSLGSFLGATIATRTPGSYLKLGFGILVILMAIRMLTLRVTDVERPVKEKLWLWFALAFPIGIITGIIGIGGGIFVVPILVMVLGFRMKNATATSLAMMLFTSTGGIIGYIVNGLNTPGLPSYTIGYINWPAWIALTIGSIGLAQIGASVAHRVPDRVLRLLLVAIQFYVALDMLGAIRWIAGHF